MSLLDNQYVKISSVDADDNTYVSNSYPLGAATKIALQVVGVTGTHATHVFKLQESNDDTTWVDIGSGSVTGAGIVTVTDVASKFVKIAEPTAEGSAATVDLHLSAKP